MIDVNKHKFFLVQILKDIYADIELANCLGFKGGTALMFFMQKHYPVNMDIIETRMNMAYADYLQRCIDRLESMNNKGLLQGLGELMDKETKKFVRTKLLTETIGLLKFYKDYPIVA